MATATRAKNAVESLREVVQDLLVPDLKALRVSVDSLREETKTSIEALRSEIRLRDEKQSQAIQALDLRQSQAIQALSDKLSYTIDIRERLAVLEDRVPRI